MFVKQFHLHKYITMKNLSPTTISIIVGIITALGFFVSRCNSRTEPVTTGQDIIQQVFDQQYVDSLLSVNRDLKRSNDSLTVELGIALINIPGDKETQSVTQVIREFIYKDTSAVYNELLQQQLDSLSDSVVDLIATYDRNSEIEREQLEQEFKQKLEAAANIPRVIEYETDHISVNAISTPLEQVVLVTGIDTLNITHSVERKWFLGKKTYRVTVDNTNPHITTSGTTYIIDKKLQRQARRSLRRQKRNQNN